MSAGIKVIKRQNLASILTEDLRKRILTGEFEGGTLLRQELIAQEYGVSRMPVRETLRQLDSEGLVIMQANRGAVVSELSLSEIEEMFDLRVLLEVDLIRRAIPKMTKASLRKSELILQELDSAYQTQDIGQWGMLNAKFHMSLYEPSDRSISLSFVNRISLQVDRYLRLQLSVTQTMSDGSVDHQTLFEHCKNRKVDEAVDLLQDHILRARAQLITILARRASKAS